MTHHDSKNVVTKSIIVKRDAVGAFRVWTEQIKVWWPAGHSISGDPRTQVFIESKVGGRFYERASDGAEYDWGRVIIWEPPHYLAYTWYLGSGRKIPTRVDVNFVSIDSNQTRVEIEHRGPELIGELWWRNKSRYNLAWDNVLSKYAATCHPN